MDLQEIKNYIETNSDKEEVKNYIGGFITSDRVENFLNSEDGKKLLQPKLDSYATKAIKSHDEKFKASELPKLLDEEIKKRFPETDPKDIELSKLKSEIDKMQKESLRKDLTNKAIKIATDKKLPVELVDYLIGESEEITTKNIETLEKVFGTHVETLVQERLKGNSYTPPSGGTSEGQLDNMSPTQLMSMGYNKQN